MLNKEELQKKSIIVFESNEGLNEVFATTDGQIFYDEGYATSWAVRKKSEVIKLLKPKPPKVSKTKKAK